ncbi:SMP-30/gluconolactonase/LRE family protein [Pseudonocardia sp. NPDC049154]|uniref:SMP-30/gluconolactonase/LRE family protein n=1 Tax=Pseudonocardia sp. NPDC049154 TaxID=3155501 RepID=UPI00340B5473
MTAQQGTGRLVVSGIGFAEGPRWHEGALWFSDMARERICRLVDEPGAPARAEDVGIIPGTPSGLGWLPDGTLLAVSMHRRTVYRVDADGARLHADLRRTVPADLNDMVVAPNGNAYVTGFGYDAAAGEKRQATGVCLVRPDGSVELQQGELWRPNGVAVTADGRRLVVAETRLHRISVQDIAADGTLGERRDLAHLPSGTWADGVCLDAEDAVWVADPKGHGVFRFLADGTLDRQIDFGMDSPVACVLGGPERRTLYLTVGPVRPMHEARTDPQGRIVAIDVDVPGAGRP